MQGADTPVTKALGKMTPEERKTKLDQAIAFLNSVPGFEDHAKRLQLFHSTMDRMFEIKLTSYIRDKTRNENINPLSIFGS